MTSGYQASSHHSFDIKLALQLKSVELAIVVHHFQYWINHNQKLGINFVDESTWTYQTRDQIAANFPYFTSEQIRRYTDKLVKMNILKKGNYNKLAIDKTTWYSFVNEEMFTIGNSAKSTGESANRDGESAKAIPKSIPKSKAKDIRDLGDETEIVDKSSKRNLDAKRRWKLTDQEVETFLSIQALGITDKKGMPLEQGKLAFWAKNFSLDRILDVYNESKAYKPDCMKSYMSSLLDKKSNVPNANAEANRQFLYEYLVSNPWYGVKIFKRYMKYPIGKDHGEIDLNMNPMDFISRLIEKHEQSRE